MRIATIGKFRRLAIVTGIVLISIGSWLGSRQLTARKPVQAFSGEQALLYVDYQISLGPRIPESKAHAQVVRWMVDSLIQAGWEASIQDTTRMGHPIQNVIGKRGSGSPWIILGAHYDSRLWASQDPDPARRTQPVPGANDGASGVAVLLELARTLPATSSGQIWLVFFDGEDNGEIPGWDWLLGSKAIVDSLTAKPDKAVVIDMIGDKNLDIYQERNSNVQITQDIWNQAAALGYAKVFIPEYKYSMLDDHTPFLQAGIPAIDIIDFDYPYWHTTQDTADKVSAQSLQAVGDTLRAWLIQQK